MFVCGSECVRACVSMFTFLHFSVSLMFHVFFVLFICYDQRIIRSLWTQNSGESVIAHSEGTMFIKPH